jgi:hypothetical protein
MGEQKDLFDWKHAKLWRFSFVTDIFASLVLIVSIFLALGEVYRYSQLAHTQFQTNLIGLFTQQPIFIFDVLLQMASFLLQGAVFYLLLEGVALGLNMIVETDINYREKTVVEALE